jgi:hypothetical protein
MRWRKGLRNLRFGFCRLDGNRFEVAAQKTKRPDPNCIESGLALVRKLFDLG